MITQPTMYSVLPSFITHSLTVTTLKDITEKGLPYNLGLSWINEKTFKRQWENSLFSEAVAFHCLAKVILLIWPTLVWARDDSPG